MAAALLDIFPRNAMNSMADCGWLHAKFSGHRRERFATGAPSPEFSDQFRVELRASLPRPSFYSHVRAVIGIGADEEMVGANAGRIVAMMANQHPVRHRAEVQFPRDAMRQSRCDAVTRLGPENAVALFQAGTSPNPAVTRHVNVAPETNLDSFPIGRITAGQAAKDSLASCGGPRAAELLTADAARQAHVERRSDRLRVHFWSLLRRFRGAMPSAVRAARGLLLPSILPLLEASNG